jgi:hypothetical protein
MGYITLPKNSEYDSEYILLYKDNLNHDKETDQFGQLGNEIKYFGFFEKHLYICDNKTILLYDPLTLMQQEIVSPKVGIKKKEMVLFSLDNGNVITMTPNNKYYIKKIEIIKNELKLSNIEQNIFANYKDGKTKFDYPFYVININNDIYVNSKKTKINENITIKGNYIYLENNTGTGIIIERGEK